MESQPEDLITTAAQAVAERTPSLQRELDLLVAEAETWERPVRGRLGRRAGIAGAAVVGILSLGTAAVATGVIDGPAEWLRTTPTVSSGATCEVTYYGELQIQPSMRGAISAAEGARTLAAARAFVSTFDVSTISVPEAVEKWLAAYDGAKADSLRRYAEMTPSEQAAVRRKGGPYDFGPKPTGDELEIEAVRTELFARMGQDLRRQGLNPDLILTGQGSRCSEQPKQ